MSESFLSESLQGSLRISSVQDEYIFFMQKRKEGLLYSLVTTSIIQGIKSIPVYVEADEIGRASCRERV